MTTGFRGPLVGDNSTLGGAGIDLPIECTAGDTDMVGIFDDFNGIVEADTFGDATNWETVGWTLTDVGVPVADYITMNDPNGGQLPCDSLIRVVPGTTDDTGGTAQLDYINGAVGSPVALAAFPHLWIPNTSAGATILDDTSWLFACRLGLRADTTTGGSGAWDSKCFVGWAEAGVSPMMTAATGALTTGAGTGPKIGFHVPEDGSIDAICQRTETVAYVEGTNFTELVAAGGVDGTVANGAGTAGDTMWFDLALKMHITDMSDASANGYTEFFWRPVRPQTAVGAQRYQEHWQRHGTTLFNQTPSNDVTLVPTIEVINGPTADVDGEVYLDWWVFGCSRYSLLPR